MNDADLAALREQISELLASVRILGMTIHSRQNQSDVLQDFVKTNIATLHQNQRDLDEKLDCVICVMQHDLEGLRAGATQNGRSVDELLRVVHELRAPVTEMIALRSRVGGVVLGIGAVGSVAMWLAEPLYRWIIENNYLRQ